MLRDLNVHFLRSADQLPLFPLPCIDETDVRAGHPFPANDCADRPPPLPLPYLEDTKVPAGFPSPADDFAVKPLDLNDLLVTRPLATFLMRASGTSMIDAGIQDGDLLVVNRALRPEHGQVVVAQIDNDFTVKYLHKKGDRVKLVPANKTFPEILMTDGQTLQIIGVVTGSVTVFGPKKF